MLLTSFSLLHSILPGRQYQYLGGERKTEFFYNKLLNQKMKKEFLQGLTSNFSSWDNCWEEMIDGPTGENISASHQSHLEGWRLLAHNQGMSIQKPFAAWSKMSTFVYFQSRRKEQWWSLCGCHSVVRSRSEPRWGNLGSSTRGGCTKNMAGGSTGSCCFLWPQSLKWTFFQPYADLLAVKIMRKRHRIIIVKARTSYL